MTERISTGEQASVSRRVRSVYNQKAKGLNFLNFVTIYKICLLATGHFEHATVFAADKQ